MKIKHSEISLSSTHAFQEHTTVRTSSHTEWESLFNTKLQEQMGSNRFTSTPFLENAVQNYKQKLITQAHERLTSHFSDPLEILNLYSTNETHQPNTLLGMILEKMISMEILVGEFTDFQFKEQFAHQTVMFKNEAMDTGPELHYQTVEQKTISYTETEETCFKSNGTIQTEAGDTIRFELDLNMQREWVYEEKFTFIEKGVMKLIDPLVINLNGNIPEFTDYSFSFDLDADGTEEQLPLIKEGAGFLSLDKNSDGIVNNGNELFGPATGNGFDALRQYDSDQNNWIDENDSIYDSLSIWTPEEDGYGHMTSIRESGVGAIYLAQAGTRFDLKDADNNLFAQIKETSVFLHENGKVGTIQELDFNTGTKDGIDSEGMA